MKLKNHLVPEIPVTLEGPHVSEVNKRTSISTSMEHDGSLRVYGFHTLRKDKSKPLTNHGASFSNKQNLNALLFHAAT